jgi:hypothetical protein
MRFARLLLLLLACFVFQVFTGIAHAGNCKGVKFNFENSRSTKVKIDKVIVESKGSKWSQDISNKVIFPGESYTTDKLRFGRMNTGVAGTFRVKFLWFDPQTERWGGSKMLNGQSLRCDDNMTIRFELK